jgi:hypothetical protein
MPFYRSGIFLAHRLISGRHTVGGMPSLIRRGTSLVALHRGLKLVVRRTARDLLHSICPLR